MSGGCPEGIEVKLLQQQLDIHIQEYTEHRAKEEERWDHLITAQEKNTQCILELTDSTKDLVTAWQAANSTVKVVSVIGGFIKWVVGVGAFVVAAWLWFTGKSGGG